MSPGGAGTAEVAEELVAAAAAPREQEPWVAVELVGEHVQHRRDVLARVLPVGARACGRQVAPALREERHARAAGDDLELGRHLAGDELGRERTWDRIASSMWVHWVSVGAGATTVTV